MEKIPANFATIIKRTETRQALKLKAESDKEASTHEEKRRQEIEFVMRLVDRFVQPLETFIDLESIKRDNWDCYATARIPGLAPITLHFGIKHLENNKTEEYLKGFQVQRPRTSRYDDQNDHAYYSPQDYYSFKPSQYAETLVCAKDSAVHFQELVESVEARNKANAERQEVLNAKAAQKENEIQALFEMVSDDPISIALLRLFHMIQYQREDLENEIENAYANVETTEGHYLNRINAQAQRMTQIETDLRDAQDKTSRLENEVYALERKAR